MPFNYFNFKSSHYLTNEELNHRFYRGLFSFVFEKTDIYTIELTPLHYAVLKNNRSFIKDLLNDGVDINQCGRFDGDNGKISADALGFAIFSNSKELVNEFLSRGSRLKDYDYKLAIDLMQYDIFRFLLGYQTLNGENLKKVINYACKFAFEMDDVDLLKVLNDCELLTTPDCIRIATLAFFKNNERIYEYFSKYNRNELFLNETELKTAFNQCDIDFLKEHENEPELTTPQVIERARKRIYISSMHELHHLFFNCESQKPVILAAFQYDYLSILNSILNVLISVYTMSYYSFTKGYQNISSKDLRFFAFGEKQKIENIFDEIENEKKSAVLSA